MAIVHVAAGAQASALGHPNGDVGATTAVWCRDSEALANGSTSETACAGAGHRVDRLGTSDCRSTSGRLAATAAPWPASQYANA
jgi:hypothetical protein